MHIEMFIAALKILQLGKSNRLETYVIYRYYEFI